MIKTKDPVAQFLNEDKASEALKTAQPEIMRAAGRGILHKNTASRKISRLAHRISKLETA